MKVMNGRGQAMESEICPLLTRMGAGPPFGAAIEMGMTFSEGWWEREMRLNLCNPAFDFERARKVMTENLGGLNNLNGDAEKHHKAGSFITGSL